MDLDVFVEKLKSHYNRHGGGIEICIGVGKNTYQVRNVEFDAEQNRLVIY